MGPIATDITKPPAPPIPGNTGKMVRMYPRKPSFIRPLISMVNSAIMARAAATPRFPVAVAPHGNSPSKFE